MHLQLVAASPEALCPLAARLAREHAVEVGIVGIDSTGNGANQQKLQGDILVLPGVSAGGASEQPSPRGVPSLLPSLLPGLLTRSQGVVIQVVHLTTTKLLPPLPSFTAWLLETHPARWAAEGCCLVQVLTLRSRPWSGGWLALRNRYVVALLAPPVTPEHLASVALQVLDRGRSRVLPTLLLALIGRCLACLLSGVTRPFHSR